MNKPQKPGLKAAFGIAAVYVSVTRGASAQNAAPQATSNLALTANNAVEIAIKNNPTLHIALLQETQARYAVKAEEALYDSIFDASAGIGHNANPSLRNTDGTIVSTTDSVNLSAMLTKTFATGAVVQASLQAFRRVSASPPINQTGGELAVGPAYSLTGQLQLTQPFLRGYGTTLGLATLREARLNRTVATLVAQQTGSQILHDALTDYWELWYATEAERIDLASRDLAKTLQLQADEQVKSGTLAKVDALPYATQAATQDGALDAAVTTVRQKALTLALQIGQVDRTAELKAADTPPDVLQQQLDDRAINDALAASYQLKQMEAELQIAQDQAKIAGDALRPELNLTASVSAQGLGNRAVSPAFDQFGQLQALSGSVGLAFETPVTDNRRSAQVAEALLAVHIAEKQIESERQQIKTDLETSLALRDAAKRRLEFALITDTVAHDQAEGVRGKFQSGTALAIEVQQANDSYQIAQLAVQRARVDVVEAELDLLHKRGKLLVQYTDLLKSYQPTALILKDADDPM